MPPTESEARTLSTTEIASDRGWATHAPSAVDATHDPPAAAVASGGCHAANTWGSSTRGRPRRTASKCLDLRRRQRGVKQEESAQLAAQQRRWCQVRVRRRADGRAAARAAVGGKGRVAESDGARGRVAVDPEERLVAREQRAAFAREHGATRRCARSFAVKLEGVAPPAARGVAPPPAPPTTPCAQRGARRRRPRSRRRRRRRCRRLGRGAAARSRRRHGGAAAACGRRRRNAEDGGGLAGLLEAHHAHSVKPPFAASETTRSAGGSKPVAPITPTPMSSTPSASPSLGPRRVIEQRGSGLARALRRVLAFRPPRPIAASSAGSAARRGACLPWRCAPSCCSTPSAAPRPPSSRRASWASSSPTSPPGPRTRGGCAGDAASGSAEVLQCPLTSRGRSGCGATAQIS